MTTDLAIKKTDIQIDIATEINEEHRLCGALARDALGHALRVGELLTKAKATVAHGEWLPWIEKHCEFSIRTAQGYIRLHERRDAIAKSAAVAHLPLRDALRMVRDRSRPAIEDILRDVYFDVLDPAAIDAAMALGEADVFAGATRDISEQFICQGIETVDHANALLNFIRPEEDPAYVWLHDDTDPAIVTACRRIGEYAASGAIPSWRLAAFWWLSVAVQLKAPPHDLAVFIHNFRRKLESCAICWQCIFWRMDHRPHDVMWWGHWGDLHHAGLLGPGDKLQNDPPTEWIRSIMAAGGKILPSILQPRAWRSEENEAWRRKMIAGLDGSEAAS
jgi:hypothetical protein